MQYEDYSNQTLKLLHERASCRSFTEEKIPPDVLQHLLEAGIHSATGGNLQPYSIIKIEAPETRGKLAKLCSEQDFIAEAPLNLLFCIDLHRLQRWTKLEVAPFTGDKSFRHFWIAFQDTLICAQTICVAADALGLGSVYIGSVLECFPELRDMFRLPQGVFPVVLLCLGYPQTRPQPRKKLGVEVIVHAEQYREIEDQALLDSFDEKYDHYQLEITEERLETIAQVCRTVGGEAFAARCIERIKEQGYINRAQRYFGLHYRADRMPRRNDDYLELMEAFGFDWFKKYQPVEDKA